MPGADTVLASASNVICISVKLEGFTTQSRHGVIFEVTESILACGGVILDHQQFSNQLLRLSIEIRRERLRELLEGIEAPGICPGRSYIAISPR